MGRGPKVRKKHSEILKMLLEISKRKSTLSLLPFCQDYDQASYTSYLGNLQFTVDSERQILKKKKLIMALARRLVRETCPRALISDLEFET